MLNKWLTYVTESAKIHLSERGDDMARLKKVNLFPGYARTNEVNFEVLARCTELAKGNRSLREFAEVCETTGATLSRIINQQVSAPIGDRLLMSIAENAAEGSGVTLDVMLVANGLQPIRLNDAAGEIDWEKTIQSSSTINIRKDEAVSEQIARDILQNELLNRGYSLKLEMEPVIYEQKKDFRYTADFGFKTNALKDIGLDTWCFDVMSNWTVHSRHRMHTLFSACYLGNPTGNRKKLSLVVLNKEAFERLKEQYAGIVIRDYISIIYIDPAQRKVIEEYNLETTEKNMTIFKEV